MQQPFLALATLVGTVGILVTVGCGNTAEIAADVCGNLVTEGGEQCDGQENCLADGSQACRYSCEIGTRECPGDRGCSVEGVCIESAGSFVEFAAAKRYEMPADHITVGDIDGDGRDDVIGVGDSVRVRFGSVSEPLAASYEKRIRPPTGAATIGQIDGTGGLDIVFPTADGIFTLVSRGRELESIPYATAGALPVDSASDCAAASVPNGWRMCKTVDLNRDGRMDQVGFRSDLDNIAIQLGRVGGPLPRTLDTVDIITDITVGDFDGDGFGDIAFAARAAVSGASQTVSVVYGAPQPEAFATVPLAAADTIIGIAAADLSQPADGVDDVAISRSLRGATGIAVYRGDTARDLSAPFALDAALDRQRTGLDVPYAIVAGEFVGGKGSGIDVMAYARNPLNPERAFFWWLRGLGGAQLTIGAIDEVTTTQLDFSNGSWQVGDLVVDQSALANGPDEVIGLSPVASDCNGPALTVAVPSARFTAAALLRSACLQLDGVGWQPSTIGLLAGDTPRAVSLAQRGSSWWLGQAPRLDDAVRTKQLSGTVTELQATCLAPQLWKQIPNSGTALSWSCDTGSSTTVVAAKFSPNGVALAPPKIVATANRGSAHVTGDFNGDGLTDIAIRQGRELTVLLQCSTDMVGTTPGC